jgi:hypothetical protein
MALKQYRPQLIALLCGTLFYGANRLLFLLPDYSVEYTVYHHSLEVVYAFFTACALVILTVVAKVHKRSPDNTGYVFIGTTLVQMGLCYLMLKPILAVGKSAQFEKMNFFFIFILFLVIETVLTIRLLNNKQ